MAWDGGESAVDIGTIVAAGDLRTKQFYFVTLDTAGKAVLVSAAGGKALGVLQNKPNTGEACVIRKIGTTKVVAGTALATMVPIMASAAGKCIAAATTGSSILGFNLTPGGADLDVITATINCGNGVV